MGGDGVIRAREDSPIVDKLTVFYQLRQMLEDWTPTEWSEDTHIILAIREMIGYDNSEILKDQEW